MIPPDATTDSRTAGRGHVRAWRAFALILAAVVLVETVLLLPRVPSGPVPATAAVSMPDFVGRSIEDARMIAEAIGLEIQPTGRVSDEPIATVLEQQPTPGVIVAQGAIVSIVVATAAAEVVVPDLIGIPEPEALRLLSDAGLLPGTRTETPAPLIDSGAIASQDPAAGARVARGTPVAYAISTATASPSAGPTTNPTPQVPSPVPPVTTNQVGDYRCMILPEATDRIRADGFTVGRVSYSIEGGPVDDTWAVVQQDPAPNSSFTKGGPIDILMASPFGTCARPSSGS